MLDGIVDVIAAEINDAVDRLPDRLSERAWKAALRGRILDRAPGDPAPPVGAPGVRDADHHQPRGAALPRRRWSALMRAGGFSYDLIHHALHALGSRALGFSQELFDPAGGGGRRRRGALASHGRAGAQPGRRCMAEVAHDDPDSTLGWCDDQTEFEFGLDLILDGLDRLPPGR